MIKALHLRTIKVYMRNFLLVLLASIAFHQVSAQNKFAVKAGYNYAFVDAKYSGVKQPYDAKSGFGIAALAKIPFDGVLHFSPFVGYNMRGFTIKPKSGNLKKEEFTLHYLDIVPALSVDLPVNDNFFVISTGPLFGFTNFGRLKTTDINNVTKSEKIKFGYDSYGWFDVGLSSSVGYHMKKAFVELGYTHGFVNINNNEEFDGRNIKNRMLSLNFGYYFK